MVPRAKGNFITFLNKLEIPHSNAFYSAPCRTGEIRGNHRFFSEKCSGVYDLVVIGGGIVGTATARELILRHPGRRMAIVEKESQLAFHQSGRNSGVVHAGIYYKPGTLKAKLCVQGLNLAYAYFEEKNIPYKKCGKLIIATNPTEVVRLDELYMRGMENQVPDLKKIKGEEIKKIEPHCQGLKALHSPHTGIVDWGLVTRRFGQDFEAGGGEIFLNFQVQGFREADSSEMGPVVVYSGNEGIKAKYVLTCGGLYSDKLSVMSGCAEEPRIVPFRGEYLLLKPGKRHLVNGNIYPVPDPRFPFLGVHFTPRMDGNVWLGPNAVLAFKKEGYNLADFDVKELIEIVAFSGFRKLAGRYLSFGTREMLKSLFVSLQVKESQKFIPEIKTEDVVRGPSGVRAQAMDFQGNLVDDFVFEIGSRGIGKRVLHCRNAPSPGATSSLAIAKLIADEVDSLFPL